MNQVIGLHPDELPIADWLNTRINQPPPGSSWAPGGTVLLPQNEFAFDLEIVPILLDLLGLYAETSDNDHDLNPEAVNAALRLREKIVEAAR